MNARISNYWIPLAVIGIVVLAAGAFLLSSNPIDAQSSIENACNDVAAVQSMRVVMQGVETRDGKTTQRFEWDLKINGSDMHRHMRSLDGPTKVDHYQVGDKYYIQHTDAQGVAGDWRVINLPPSPGPGGNISGAVGPVGQVDGSPDFCGLDILSDHSYEGKVTLEGESVKHFKASTDESLLSSSEDRGDWEFWVDDSGALLQFSVDELSQGSIGLVLTGTVSYPSEPFTITAPTIN